MIGAARRHLGPPGSSMRNTLAQWLIAAFLVMGDAPTSVVGSILPGDAGTANPPGWVHGLRRDEVGTRGNRCRSTRARTPSPFRRVSRAA
eukprot:15483189-Alexandrium_andersonii.AAC.1